MKNKMSKFILIATLMSTSICSISVVAEEINPVMQTSNQTLMEPENIPTAVQNIPLRNTVPEKEKESHIVRNVVTGVAIGAAAVATVYVGAAFLIFAILGGVAI